MSNGLSFFFMVVMLAGNMQLMHASKRFVLSGAPGIGKTTVLKELARRGYQTIPETYTHLFEQAAAENELDIFFHGPEQLETLLLTEQLRRESLLANHLPAFLDRSAVDIVAYGYYLHAPISDEMLRLSERNYDLIFFLEPLPEELYKNSCVRKETREQALEIHSMLKTAYLQRGYAYHQIIDVPFGTPQERVQYILDIIALMYADVFDIFIHKTLFAHMPYAVESLPQSTHILF